MSFIDDDLDAMIAGLDSRTLVLGAYSGPCLMNEADQFDSDRAGDPVLTRQTVLVVAKAEFVDDLGAVTVTRGDTATVDGIAYGVTDVRVGGADGTVGGVEIDGRELHVWVVKV